MTISAPIFSTLTLSLFLKFAAPPSSPPPAPRPRPLLAAAEVTAINLGVWAFLQYPGDQFYTYVSWDTICDNIRYGLRWDNSRYAINFLHHPYHGALYFSAGRASGLGFWGSTLAALGGSLQWEFVWENVGPSINDLITTTFGGGAYGEICYRLSALVRKKAPRWLERAWREGVGAILDPVGAANRLLNGRKDDDPSLPGGPDYGRVLDGQFFLAGPAVLRSSELAGTSTVPVLGFVLRYGGAAGTGWAGWPFDVFSVDARLRPGPDGLHLSLDAGGALFGKTLAARNGGTGFIGVYQHHDFYGIDTLRLSATSFTGGWTSCFAAGPDLRLTASARLGWLALGASDDFAAAPDDRKNYNLSMGLAAAAELTFAAKGYEYASASWRHYRLFNLDVLSSRAGREAWNIVQGRVSVPVWQGLGLGFEAEYCGRAFDFRDHPSGSRRLFEGRVFTTWQF